MFMLVSLAILVIEGMCKASQPRPRSAFQRVLVTVLRLPIPGLAAPQRAIPIVSPEVAHETVLVEGLGGLMSFALNGASRQFRSLLCFELEPLLKDLRILGIVRDAGAGFS